MKMRVKPLVVDVIEDDGMWLDVSTMTYYDKDSLEPISKPGVNLEKEIERYTEETIHLPITYKRTPMDIMESDWIKCARHFYELGKNARKEDTL